jgi:predicted ABC-type ATPase
MFLNCPEFVNADEIARGLSGFYPEDVAFQAGRLMLVRLNELARQRVDFAFETTLASRSFAPWLRLRQGEGYEFHLLYVWLPSVDLAIERVALRVRAGGHNVPIRDIRRRYERSRNNFFEIYMSLANTWEVYDTASRDPNLVAFGGRAKQAVIRDPSLWHCLTERP